MARRVAAVERRAVAVATHEVGEEEGEDNGDSDGDDDGEEAEAEVERLPGTAATCARSLTRSKGATRVREAAPERAPARAMFQPTFLFFLLLSRSAAGDDDDGIAGDETGNDNDAIARSIGFFKPSVVRALSFSDLSFAMHGLERRRSDAREREDARSEHRKSAREKRQ